MRHINNYNYFAHSVQLNKKTGWPADGVGVVVINNNLILAFFNYAIRGPHILGSLNQHDLVNLDNVFRAHNHSQAIAPTDPTDIKGRFQPIRIDAKETDANYKEANRMYENKKHENRSIAHTDEPANVANDGRKVRGANSGNVVNDAKELRKWQFVQSAADEGEGEAAARK